MIVELHMLQNFAPSCLNRDDTNSPKECQFGGYRRARISSQCVKRAIRQYFNDNFLVSPEFLAKRTRLLADELTKRLVKEGKQEEEARIVSTEAITITSLKLSDNKKTQYLLFVAEKEIHAFANIILKHWDELRSNAGGTNAKSIAKELLQNLDGGKAADLALFGRMLADLPDKNIDAACQVAHAISTHKVGVEFDFYTAVDDLQSEGETGAGMMGDIEFNSACYYRYANIDLEQLKNNLDRDDGLAQKTVEAFIRASASAVPSGKQNSFAAQNPPDFIMAVIRHSGSWSLVNAFARPVIVKEGCDLVADSIGALADYWRKLNRAYSSDSIMAKPAMSLRDVNLDGLDQVDSFEGLVQQVNQAITSKG